MNIEKNSFQYENKLLYNSEFYRELVDIINKHSIENYSDTPDFILANYLIDCLNAFNNASNNRKNWFKSPSKDA